MASTNKDDELSDEEMRKLLKPNCSGEEVKEALKETFFLKAANVKIKKQLDSYDDVNFMIEMDGTPYLLKVHNGVESKDYLTAYDKSKDYNSCTSVIHLQNAIMQHLHNNQINTSNPQLHDGVPLVVAPLKVVSEAHSPCLLVVRLLSWVPGKPMSDQKAMPVDSLVNAGQFLGKMNKILDQFDATGYPSVKRYHAWDQKNTCDLRQFVSCIKDEARRKMVESVIDTFETRIIKSGVCDKLRKSINQGDFNDANILINEESQISGVIDFGDSVESWRVLDLSVAMAYSMLTVYGKKGRALAAAAAILRGYSQEYKLDALELEHLHLLMACRLACSATLGAYSYQQNPENKYLLLHAEPAWKTLELVWGLDTKWRNQISRVLRGTFEQACNPPRNGDDGTICSTDLEFPDPNIKDVFAELRDDGPSTAKKRKTDSTNKPSITFVTGNKKKLEEVKRILGAELPFLVDNKKIDLPELQGDPLEIAKEKCITAAKEIGGAVITEDTSLCFTSLKSLPGPYIKWFLDKCGHEGLNQMLAGYDDKSAYAQTVVAFCPGPGKDVVVFDGRTTGIIVPARGKLDFGWDPIFEPDEGKGSTYAEMTKEGKDAISHRSRAFTQLKEYFSTERENIKSSIL